MNKTIQVNLFCTLAILSLTGFTKGQTRDEKVRDDWQKLKADSSWYYDDLDAGIKAAKRNGKPLMVVLRCIP